MQSKPAIAHPAATLILLREKRLPQKSSPLMRGDLEEGEEIKINHPFPEPSPSEGEGKVVSETVLEVYLTRRHSQLKFLGGFYVFPGGRRDEEDFCEQAILRMRARDLKKKVEQVDSKESVEAKLGYYATAIREAFEEAGVLIACQKNGEQVLLSGEKKKELDLLRAKLHQRQISFLQILSELDLYYDLDRLFWFAHWITPKTSPKRFDTQFFVAQIPEGQTPKAFSEEIEEELWISPKEALEKWKRGEMKMIPPTLASLGRLNRISAFPDLARSRKPPMSKSK